MKASLNCLLHWSLNKCYISALFTSPPPGSGAATRWTTRTWCWRPRWRSSSPRTRGSWSPAGGLSSSPSRPSKNWRKSDVSDDGDNSTQPYLRRANQCKTNISTSIVFMFVFSHLSTFLSTFVYKLCCRLLDIVLPTVQNIFNIIHLQNGWPAKANYY